MRIQTVCLCFCLFLSSHIHAQGFQHVFPNQSGQQLLNSIAATYTPVNVLNYAMARDTLYGKILSADDDSIRCIYSGHTLYLDPTQDPTQYIYLNGSTNGMNTEHAYPQSKGAADGNARSDMHHLYPARIPVNEARGSLPYADIPDTQTEKWFIKSQIYTSIPTQNINGYSESTAANFEPREAVKGDLARSIFYFYSIYRQQADLADPDFFNLQRPTLCQWNALDPADSAELRKTWRIAAYQEGKANPFVLDCTLANRCYCPEVQPQCLVPTHAIADRLPLSLQILPNPLAEEGKISMELPYSGSLEGQIFDITGKELQRFYLDLVQEGQFSRPVEPIGDKNGGQGLFFLHVTLTDNSGHSSSETIPFLKI